MDTRKELMSMDEKSKQIWFGISWLAFIIATVSIGIGIYNLAMPLSVKGYYVQSFLMIILASLNLQKTLSDIDDNVSSVTSQWLLVTWIAFIGGIITFAIGIYNLDAALSVKGFYSQSLVLIVLVSINLQKTTMERDKFMKEAAIARTNAKKTQWEEPDDNDDQD